MHPSIPGLRHNPGMQWVEQQRLAEEFQMHLRAQLLVMRETPYGRSEIDAMMDEVIKRVCEPRTREPLGEPEAKDTDQATRMRLMLWSTVVELAANFELVQDMTRFDALWHAILANVERPERAILQDARLAFLQFWVMLDALAFFVMLDGKSDAITVNAVLRCVQTRFSGMPEHY